MPERLSRVEVLRRAVAAAVAAQSLRGVAREVGISAPSLQDIIDGAEPRRGSTLRKLENWYVRRREQEPLPEDLDAAEAALRILVRGFPADRQRTVARGALEYLSERYQAERGEERTPWLEELRRRVVEEWEEPGSGR